LSRAFTLVEVLVVMVIIAILATLTVPRLIGAQGRQAEVEAQSVRTLLSQAAQRDAVSSEPLAINFDHEKGELTIQALLPLPGEEEGGRRDWRPLPLFRPLRLTSLVIAQAAADGQAQPPDTSFRVVFAGEGAKPRPTLSLLLHTAPDLPGKARAWQADLLPGQTVAAIRTVATADQIAAPQTTTVDLDLEGLRTQPW